MSNLQEVFDFTIASARSAVQLYFEPLSWPGRCLDKIRSLTETVLIRTRNRIQEFRDTSRLNTLVKYQKLVDLMLEEIKAKRMVQERYLRMIRPAESDYTRDDYDPQVLHQWLKKRFEHNEEELVRRYLDYALLLWRRHDYDRTKTVLESLLKATEKRGSHFSAYVSFGLGELFSIRDEYDKAERFYRTAFEDFQRINDWNATAASAVNLAGIYCQLRDDYKCDAFVKQAETILVIEAKVKPDEMALRSCAQLAKIILILGDVRRAQKVLDRLVELARDVQPLPLPKSEHH